jgi:hypothetical protein
VRPVRLPMSKLMDTSMFDLLRRARADSVGWAGSPHDVVMLCQMLEDRDARILELEVATSVRAARPVPTGGAASATAAYGDEFVAGAAARFKHVPRWAAVLLEEVRQEWVERGRDAARRRAAWAMAAAQELGLALEGARAAFSRDAAVLSDRTPEGLSSSDVLEAWLEGFDDEACMHGTAEERGA